MHGMAYFRIAFSLMVRRVSRDITAGSTHRSRLRHHTASTPKSIIGT